MKNKIRKKIFTFGLLIFLVTGIAIPLAGCSVFRSTPIVKHPDSPMLIMKAEDGNLLVAIYDATNNKMIRFGYIESEEVEGWTLKKFDWESFIKKKSSTR